MAHIDKLKECLFHGFHCGRSDEGCFNLDLRLDNECDKCFDLMLKEHDEKVKEEGYDKAINDIMHIVDEADDCANAMYLLGQFVMERKMKR